MERRQLIVLGGILLALCFAIPLLLPAWFRWHKLVRVVLIAGDDNVEGYARLKNLGTFIHNGGNGWNKNNNKNNNNNWKNKKKQHEIQERFHHLRDPQSGNWTTRDDVFVFYERERHAAWHAGILNVHDYGAGAGLFGPEVEVGHVLGEAFDEPIILVKAGFSDKSLAKDWVSPSRKREHNGPLGFAWIHTLNNLRYALTHVGEVLGSKYKRHRTQLMGVIWWHGYSDIVHREWLGAYQHNLELLVRDLRAEFDRPHLPIVIAEAGSGGDSNRYFYDDPLRVAQKRVCNNSEWAAQTRCVKTAPFVHELVKNPPDTQFHYFGHGDTMIEISGLLGTTLLEMYYQQYEQKELKEEIEADYNEYVTDTEGWTVILLLAGVALVALGLYIYRGGLNRRSTRHVSFNLDAQQQSESSSAEEFAMQGDNNTRRRRRRRRRRSKPSRDGNDRQRRSSRQGRRHRRDRYQDEPDDPAEDDDENDNFEMTPTTTTTTSASNSKQQQHIVNGKEFTSVPANNSDLVELDEVSSDGGDNDEDEDNDDEEDDDEERLIA